MYNKMAKTRKAKPVSRKVKRVRRELISRNISTHHCGTRFMKNVMYIKSIAPQLVSVEDPASSLTKMMPADILEKIHTIDNVTEVIQDTALSSVLSKNKFPQLVLDPTVFNGQFRFVQVTFNLEIAGSESYSVSIPDTQTAINYAKSSIRNMILYETQYGSSMAYVSSDIIPYSVILPIAEFNDTDLRNWVREIARDPRNRVSPDTCLVFLVPSVIRNTSLDPDAKGFHAYHWDVKLPFIFCYVYSDNLTVKDPLDLYASILSHEMEETLVDPYANDSNPEVADPCYGNCNNWWISLFDNNDSYIRSSQNLPAEDEPYSYYINSMVRPRWARVSCPSGVPTETIPAEACSYAPPPLSQVCRGIEDDIGLIQTEIQELYDKLDREEDLSRKQQIRQEIHDRQNLILKLRARARYLRCPT
jgi:hypothetical protein